MCGAGVADAVANIIIVWSMLVLLLLVIVLPLSLPMPTQPRVLMVLVGVHNYIVGTFDDDVVAYGAAGVDDVDDTPDAGGVCDIASDA